MRSKTLREFGRFLIVEYKRAIADQSEGTAMGAVYYRGKARGLEQALFNLTGEFISIDDEAVEKIVEGLES